MFPVQYHGKASTDYVAVKIEADGQSSSWNVPEEVPVAFVYNRRNYSVMMATPNDLVDFAVGFSLTEQVISSADDIKSLDLYLSDKGADLRFKISDTALEKMDLVLRRRNMVGSASCGLCGLENAEVLFKKLPPVTKMPVELDADAMTKAMQDLAARQPINQKTRSVHAAAWVSLSGEIIAVREDVGRHNALDKLLGFMALRNINGLDGFVLMSSRCSYEIIEKAARYGVGAIVSISGPTAFALRKAKEANITVYSRKGKNAVRIAT